MRYFEIEFANETRNAENYDGCTVGDYSICIQAEREPSLEEATEFCKKDMAQMGYKYVVNVLEIDKEEASTFFDMDNAETRYPIFK